MKRKTRAELEALDYAGLCAERRANDRAGNAAATRLDYPAMKAALEYGRVIGWVAMRRFNAAMTVTGP